MKKTLFLICCLSLFVLSLLSAQDANSPALKPMVSHFAARSFAPGAVSRAELDLIVQAAVRAPSAANRQPWHFTVVQNQDLANKIVPNLTDGNVLIVISAQGDGKTNGVQILDCALAAESIYLAAQALGLGSRIYTGPIDGLNKNLKNDLSLPQGHNAVVLVRIGRLPAGVDAVGSASARNPATQLVTYK
ncbi:nitroreductase family protein [Leadbettera azotonutricia]|uniref:Nitroreductase n=1 Tax=Leadbettera azotonutricia (strain ATCC BAA-888 / DSM 13862 / ZAS-9) TaxID=545695 RepID=F5YA32_LEAAZ|nr:nitroreductase family protein [Leadbettera azotonutricia]AEF82840.1 nitroreductase [Leadbettera azotonutricia ZAS-9]